MRKMMKGIVAVLAVSALMAGSAFAADKLIVRNDGNTADVFKVDGGGTFQVPGAFIWDNVNKKLGIGLTDPTAAFHLNYKTALSPFILERELDGTGAVSMVGDSYGGSGTGDTQGAGMLFRYSHGTKAAPANVVVGDRLGFLVFGGNAGGIKHTAAINALVDSGTVSGTSLPTYLQFLTTSDGSVTRAERLRIAGDGRIRLSNQPAAPANNAACTVGDMILDAPNGFLYLCTSANSWKRTSFTAY